MGTIYDLRCGLSFCFIMVVGMEWLVFECLLCFYNANQSNKKVVNQKIFHFFEVMLTCYILHKRYYFRARILGNIFWSTMSSPYMPLKIESFGCGKIAFITF